MRISEQTIGRLSLYRRLLGRLQASGTISIYSHELAKLAHASPEVVRRDLMVTAYTGSTTKGYEVERLIEAIDTLLDGPIEQRIALIGVGNLGRAVLSYFRGRRRRLSIVVAFDVNPEMSGRVLFGTPVLAVEGMETVLAEKQVSLGIITVPETSAQEAADRLVAGGVRGILNFSPTPLRVPRSVYLENIDLTMAVEKVAYYARQGNPHEGEQQS
jgi:redox-sensing transcriptional repressor